MSRRTLRINQVFAYRLRDARLTKQWTQQQLADAMVEIGHPIGRAAIAKIEAGAHGAGGEVWHEPLKQGQTPPRPVSLEEAVAFAVALGVPPPSLFLPLNADHDVALAPNVAAGPKAAHAWVRGQASLDPAATRFYRLQTFPDPAARRPITVAQLEALGIQVEVD
jgi:transcriptional regulator with XRE-family HTH domain